jgi:diguanylate cyclase (GGDEF)-like protein
MLREKEKNLQKSKKEPNIKYIQSNKQVKWKWSIISIIMIAFAGLLDYFTGPEIAFSLVYLIPVMSSAWFTRKPVAIFVSILSAATWTIAEITSGRFYTHIAIHFWNTTTMLVFFLVVTLLLERFKKALNDERVLSRIDYLTGVMNPRSFYEFMATEIERCKRYKHAFTIAYIDMDDFKKINDKFGHPAGDDALRTIANTMKNNLRKIDVVARLGGDEFVILLPETDNKAATKAIKKIQKAFIQNTDVKKYSITFSIGALTCNTNPPSINKIMKSVDSLMYSVKNRGKNGIKYSIYTGFQNEEVDATSTNNK